MDKNNKKNMPPQTLAEKKKPPKYFNDRQPGDKGFSIGVVKRYSKSQSKYLDYVPTDSEKESDSDDGVGYEDSSDEAQWE